MLIGELADETGVPAKTLRFYEGEGLLHEPARLPNGYRDYGPAAVDRVTFIKQAQSAGLTLAQIGEVLAIRDRGETPCAHVAHVIDRRLQEVDRRIAELRATRGTLAELAERSGRLDPDDCDGFCHIIEGNA
ncbi:MAG: heavy metal-responsive transcriptional regulator [Actinobacteria bacterium]|nr:heavy metal-responsive transcriptional regulator [Actinomycetota bacterium]